MNKFKLIKIIIFLAFFCMFVYVSVSINHEHIDLVKNNKIVKDIFGNNLHIKPISINIFRESGGKIISCDYCISGKKGRGIVFAKYHRKKEQEPILEEIRLKKSPSKYEVIWLKDKYVQRSAISADSYYFFEIIWRVIALVITLVITLFLRLYPDWVFRLLLLRNRFTPLLVKRIIDKNLIYSILLLIMISLLFDIIDLSICL